MIFLQISGGWWNHVANEATFVGPFRNSATNERYSSHCATRTGTTLQKIDKQCNLFLF